jgi:hypothetical protein
MTASHHCVESGQPLSSVNLVACSTAIVAPAMIGANAKPSTNTGPGRLACPWSICAAWVIAVVYPLALGFNNSGSAATPKLRHVPAIESSWKMPAIWNVRIEIAGLSRYSGKGEFEGESVNDRTAIAGGMLTAGGIGVTRWGWRSTSPTWKLPSDLTFPDRLETFTRVVNRRGGNIQSMLSNMQSAAREAPGGVIEAFFAPMKTVRGARNAQRILAPDKIESAARDFNMIIAEARSLSNAANTDVKRAVETLHGSSRGMIALGAGAALFAMGGALLLGGLLD